MPKMNVSKLLFKNLHGVKDFVKLESLYGRYEKIKVKNNPKAIEKSKADILALLPNIEEEIKRVVTIYSAGLEEMKEDTPIYTTTNAKSFLEELKSIQDRIAEIKKGIGIEIKTETSVIA